MNPKRFQIKLVPEPTQNAENTKADTETCFQEPDKNRELKKLFDRLWEAADELRANSKLRSTQYSTPVLGILFLRYAYHKFEEATKELEKKYAGRDRPIRKLDYQAEGAIYLTEKARYRYLLELPEGASIGKALDDASVFEKMLASVPKEPNHIPPFKIKKPTKQKSKTESQKTEGDEGE